MLMCEINYLSNHVVLDSTKYLNPASFVYLQYSLEYFIKVCTKCDLLIAICSDKTQAFLILFFLLSRDGLSL